MPDAPGNLHGMDSCHRGNGVTSKVLIRLRKVEFFSRVQKPRFSADFPDAAIGQASCPRLPRLHG